MTAEKFKRNKSSQPDEFRDFLFTRKSKCAMSENYSKFKKILDFDKILEILLFWYH